MDLDNNSLGVCNDPSVNSTDEVRWKLDEDFRAGGIVLSVFFSILLVVGLPWNIMVVITIIKEKLYVQPTIVLLLSLAIADILELLMLPFSIIIGGAGEYIFGTNDHTRCQVCKVLLLLTGIFLMETLCTITAMSVDRLIYIRKPLQYERLVNARWMFFIVLIIWILSIIHSSIKFAVFRIPIFHPLFLLCDWTIIRYSPQFYFNLIYHLLILSVPLTIIIICNMWVVCIVQKNIRKIYKVRKSLTVETDIKTHQEKRRKKMMSKYHQKQLHLVRVFGGLLCSNIVSWLPYIILIFLSLGRIEDNISISRYTSFCNAILLSQVVIHPILETTMIRDVRLPMLEMIQCRCFKKHMKSLENDAKVSIPSSFCDFWQVCAAAVMPTPNNSINVHGQSQEEVPDDKDTKV